MTDYVGVDWASGCWVTVTYDSEPQISTEPSILNVWEKHRSDAVILVDVPIGLADCGARDCDKKARELLKGRSSTVFSLPTEGAVREREYKVACEKNEGFNGLGSQSWWLIPQIREVATFLQSSREASEAVFESHPEVCFAELTEGEMLPPKSTDDGVEARLDLLKEASELGGSDGFGEEIADFIEDRRQRGDWYHRIRSGRFDDVVDAAVLALTASVASRRDFPTLPADRDHTEGKVIVYPGK